MVKAKELAADIGLILKKSGQINRDNLHRELLQAGHRDSKRSDGSSNLRYMASWALSFEKAAELMSNENRGVWELTEKGRRFPFTDPNAVRNMWREAGKILRKKDDEKEGVVGAKESSDVSATVREQIEHVFGLEAVGAILKPEAFDVIKRLLAKVPSQSSRIRAESSYSMAY
jgi:hypothetical protein